MNESSPNGRPDRRSEDDRAAIQLDEALRRARRDAADRAEADSGRRRPSERERLEHLLAALRPILRRIPRDADLFDVGVAQGFDRDGGEGRPRLFLDMIGYVECADDGGFRLAQSTRHGRVALGEASELAGAMRLVCDYVARRIVEREQALASDRTVEDAARRLLRGAPDLAPSLPRIERVPPDAPRRPPPVESDEPPPAPRGRARDADRPLLDADDAPSRSVARPWRERLAAVRDRLSGWTRPFRARRVGTLERGLVFAVQFLGSAALTLLVALAAWWAWKAVGFVK